MDTAIQAIAGTLESNDIFITITPGTDADNAVSLESSVMKQFGQAILETISASLAEHGLAGVAVNARDRGALDCTVKARMEAAILRYKEKTS